MNPPLFLSDRADLEATKLLFGKGAYNQVIDSLKLHQSIYHDCWFCELQIAYCHLLKEEAETASDQLKQFVIQNKLLSPDLPYYYSISLLLEGKKALAKSELKKMVENLSGRQSSIKRNAEALLAVL